MRTDNTEVMEMEMDSTHKQGETKMENKDNKHPCPFCAEFYSIVNNHWDLYNDRPKLIERRAQELTKARDKLLKELKNIKNQKHQQLTQLNLHLSEEVCEELVSIIWKGRMDELSKSVGQFNTDCMALSKEIEDFKQDVLAWNKKDEAFFTRQYQLKKEGQPFFDFNRVPDIPALSLIEFTDSWREIIEQAEKQRLKNINID